MDPESTVLETPGIIKAVLSEKEFRRMLEGIPAVERMAYKPLTDEGLEAFFLDWFNYPNCQFVAVLDPFSFGDVSIPKEKWEAFRFKIEELLGHLRTENSLKWVDGLENEFETILGSDIWQMNKK